MAASSRVLAATPPSPPAPSMRATTVAVAPEAPAATAAKGEEERKTTPTVRFSEITPQFVHDFTESALNQLFGDDAKRRGLDMVDLLDSIVNLFHGGDRSQLPDFHPERRDGLMMAVLHEAVDVVFHKKTAIRTDAHALLKKLVAKGNEGGGVADAVFDLMSLVQTRVPAKKLKGSDKKAFVLMVMEALVPLMGLDAAVEKTVMNNAEAILEALVKAKNGLLRVAIGTRSLRAKLAKLLCCGAH